MLVLFFVLGNYAATGCPLNALCYPLTTQGPNRVARRQKQLIVQ